MVYPIQSLANMEYMLYGNTPAFGSAPTPSIMNGYCVTSPYISAYNNYINPYGNLYGQYPYQYPMTPDIHTQANNKVTASPQASHTSNSDIDKIADFYNKNSQPSEGLMGCVLSQVLFAGVMHPRILAHPINSIKAFKGTEEMFAGIKGSGKLHDLWVNPETNDLMREAYFRMHKVEARQFGKIGLFRKKYSAEDYNRLKGIMQDALNSGDKEKIAKATAQLEQAYTNDGALSKGFGKVKEFFGGKDKARTVDAALNESEAISEKLSKITERMGKISYKDALKRGGGLKGGLFFMAIDLILGLGNIKEAFSKDNKTGMKQVGQTLVKGAGSAAGWAAGEALGVWASAALCAKIGTAISPGLGTAIGGVLGMVGGGIGMWLTGKLTKAAVGQDVAEKVKLDKMKQTPEGQVELLKLTAQQKNIPLDVQQSMQNVISQYSTAA